MSIICDNCFTDINTKTKYRYGYKIKGAIETSIQWIGICFKCYKGYPKDARVRLLRKEK